MEGAPAAPVAPTASPAIVDFYTPTNETGFYVHNLPATFDYDDAFRLFSPFGPLFMLKLKYGAGGVTAMQATCCIVRYYAAHSAVLARRVLRGRLFRGCSLAFKSLRPMPPNRALLGPGQCCVLAQHYLGVHRVSIEILESDGVEAESGIDAGDAVVATSAILAQAWGTAVRVHLSTHFIDGYAVAHVRDSIEPLPDLVSRLKFLRQHSHNLAVKAAFSKVKLQIEPVVRVLLPQDDAFDFSSCLLMDTEFSTFAVNDVEDPSDMDPELHSDFELDLAGALDASADDDHCF